MKSERPMLSWEAKAGDAVSPRALLALPAGVQGIRLANSRKHPQRQTVAQMDA